MEDESLSAASVIEDATFEPPHEFWIARDFDNSLWLFSTEPFLDQESVDCNPIFVAPTGDAGIAASEIDEKLFPEVRPGTKSRARLDLI